MGSTSSPPDRSTSFQCEYTNEEVADMPPILRMIADTKEGAKKRTGCASVNGEESEKTAPEIVRRETDF